MKHIINIIKIWSDSLNKKSLEKIIADAKEWHNKKGEQCVFISSWAVKLWKERIENIWKISEDFTKSALSSIGQNFLMQLYDSLTWVDIAVAQILIDDFAQEKNLAETLINLLDNNIWAIINHNDSLHPNELNNISDKTDNDKNTLYLSRILSEYSDNKVHIKRVIYLTNTHWLLDENWTTVLWWKILWEENKDYYRSFINIDNTSLSWTGWMLSKIDCAFRVLDFWVQESVIANAQEWLKCLDDTKDSTVFYY